jgi:predicted  nucleic acid-binding Zn-ribbon protein
VIRRPGPARCLIDGSTQQQAVLKQQADVMGKMKADTAKAAEGLERTSKEYRQKSSEVYAKYRKALSAIQKEYQRLGKQIGELVPAAQRKSFVWLYERL